MGLRLDAGGTAGGAQRAGEGVALAAFERPPSAHASRADAEPGGGFTVAGAIGPGVQDADSQIKRKGF